MNDMQICLAFDMVLGSIYMTGSIKDANYIATKVK